MRGPLPLLLALAICPLGAQVYERPLNDQDLQRLLPVLDADKVFGERLAREQEEKAALERRRENARHEAVVAVAGGADPLEWLTKRSRDAAAPSTATYRPTCSRGLTESAGVPSAVFSFGVDAPPAWLATAAGGLPKGDANAGKGVETRSARATAGETRSRNAAAARAEQLAQEARSFYAGRRFEYIGEMAPFQWQFLAPGRGLSATVSGVSGLANIAGCSDLATGPAVVIKPEGEMFAKGPERKTKTGRSTFAAALDKAGLSEDEYLNLKWQLITARADARDPSRLAAPPVNDEQRQTLHIRRQNADFYRRHQQELDRVLTDRLEVPGEG